MRICLLMLAAVLAGGCTGRDSWSHYLACRDNLRNLGFAVRFYSQDNEGLFPTGLDAVVPGYLREMPSCPAAGRPT